MKTQIADLWRFTNHYLEIHKREEDGGGARKVETRPIDDQDFKASVFWDSLEIHDTLCRYYVREKGINAFAVYSSYFSF